MRPSAAVTAVIIVGGCGSDEVVNDPSAIDAPVSDPSVSGPPAGPAPEITQITSVAVGIGHACGLDVSGDVVCWGDNLAGQADPPAGAFNSVSTGVWHSCGVRIDGTVVCWGNRYGMTNPPAGTFTAVSAGGGFLTCGVRSDATVACWGPFVTLPGVVRWVSGQHAQA